MCAYPCRKENKRAVVEELGVIKDDLGSPRVLPPPLFTGGDKENNIYIIKGVVWRVI